MDLPDAYVTVHLKEPPFGDAFDPFSDELILSNTIEQIHMDLYDLLDQSFSPRCRIHLTVEPKRNIRDHKVTVHLEGTTGDVEKDKELKEALYDYAIRQLEAITNTVENNIELPSDIMNTLYITDQKGNPLETQITDRRIVNAEYTFFTVIPYGWPYPIAALCSSTEQFIDTNWKRKKELTAFSIFEENIEWYRAKTGQTIEGGLANYLHINFEETLL